MLRSLHGRRRARRRRAHRRHRGHARRAGDERARVHRRQDRRAHAVLVRPQARLRRQPRTEHRRHGRLQPAVAGSRCHAPSRSAATSRRPPCARWRPTAHRSRASSTPASFVTADGPRVIEFNARFGDPEAECLLPRLESDLLEIMLAVANGTLDRVDVRWSDDASVTVMLASGGYPGAVRDRQADRRPRRRRRRRHRLPCRHEARRERRASSRTAGASSASRRPRRRWRPRARRRTTTSSASASRACTTGPTSARPSGGA